jgi:hypothetical protein
LRSEKIDMGSEQYAPRYITGEAMNGGTSAS